MMLGYFEQGVWITPQLIMSHIADASVMQGQKFELVEHVAEPIFTNGACTGYRDAEKSMGIFTAAEIKQVMPDKDLPSLSELMSRTEIRVIM